MLVLWHRRCLLILSCFLGGCSTNSAASRHFRQRRCLACHLCSFNQFSDAGARFFFLVVQHEITDALDEVNYNFFLPDHLFKIQFLLQQVAYLLHKIVLGSFKILLLNKQYIHDKGPFNFCYKSCFGHTIMQMLISINFKTFWLEILSLVLIVLDSESMWRVNEF